MFIQTETTPNPATLKFLPGITVMSKGTADFRDADSAKRSPLAVRLFKIADVSGVFLGEDFVSVTKTNEADWNNLKTPILSALLDHFTSGMPAIDSTVAAPAPTTTGAGDPVSDQIRIIIDEKVRPAVAQDGGDIVFDRFEDGIVYVVMHGACAGCPSSTATLKTGIENMLKYYVPEVRSVEAVQD